MAKKNADKATEIAKPLYEQAEQASQNKARDEALARDASAITGADVRLERRGDLQRLVIAVPELFSKRKPDIAPGHDGVIDAIAELLKKYPTYPVQIIGYTDNRGKSSELLAISAARAQSVYSALAAQGRRDEAPDGERPGRRRPALRQQERHRPRQEQPDRDRLPLSLTSAFRRRAVR